MNTSTEIHSQQSSPSLLNESTSESTLQGPQPTVSQATFNHITNVMILFNLILEAVSVGLTLLSATVYALPRMRCATASYLVALNVADAASGLLSAIKRTILYESGTVSGNTVEFQYYSLVAAYVVVPCRRMVYWLTTMVSMERFFVIAFPMKARYIKLVKYPKVCIALLTLVTFAYHAYILFQYAVQPSPFGNGYILGYSSTSLANEQLFTGIANAGKVLFSYTPLVLSLVLSVALMMALQRHATSRQSLQEVKDDGKGKESNSAERQLALTIWLSALLYTLLSLPTNTVELVSSHHSTFRYLGFEHRLYRLVVRFSITALITSRYTNFLSYLCLSSAFRHTLLAMFCPRILLVRMKAGGRNGQSSNYSMSQTAASVVTSVSQ